MGFAGRRRPGVFRAAQRPRDPEAAAFAIFLRPGFRTGVIKEIAYE